MAARQQLPQFRELRHWQLLCQQLANRVDPSFWPDLQDLKDALAWYESQLGEVPSIGLIELGPLEKSP